jgi:glycogen debranching enzyme
MGDNNDQEEYSDLIKSAKETLDNNWMGDFTVPAHGMYPHQWSWDSAFIVMGYAHYDQERAEKEFKRLFKGQWSNGMVPHIVYNESDEDTGYFPGPDFWQLEDIEQAPNEPRTSGICQPPVHAIAVRHLLKYAKDRERAQSFAADLFPKLKAWHNFLYKERDPNNEGLVYIRHPWASGQDNAPNWDKVMKRIDLKDKDIPEYQRKDTDHANSAERPSDEKYDYYVYLIGFFRRHHYDEKKMYEAGCPFMVQDILFNSLLCRAGRDLAQIAEWLGDDPTPFQEQAHKTAKAINNKLWDENHGIYVDYDLANDESVEIHMLSGFMPYFADIPSPIRAERMFNYLNTNSFSRLKGDHLAVPSYDRQEPGFSNKKYWRGPIWLNLNWLLYKGLARYGHKPYDNKIQTTLIKLCKEEGFWEYYDPGTGEGYGSNGFSWSASLLIDLLESGSVNENE